MSKSKAFNELVISAKTVDGGTIVTANLLLDSEVVDSVQKIVAGKAGTPVLGSRVRKAIKVLTEGAFPKTRLVAQGEVPGQQELPLGEPKTGN